MSIVNLTSYFVFKNTSRPKAAEVKDVAISGSNTSLKDGIVALYGFKDAMDELSVIRAREEGPGVVFCSVNIEVDVGDLKPGPLTEGEMANTRILNVRRISIPIRDTIETYWNRYLEEEGSEHLPKEALRDMSFIGMRPDLLSRLHSEPEFVNFDMIVFPSRAENRRMYQRAALFSTEHVLSITAKNYPEIDVNFPAGRFDLKKSTEKSVTL